VPARVTLEGSTESASRADVARRVFSPVERRTLADEIRDQVQNRIEVGAIGPGAALPSERVLCDEFQASRNTVREALHALVATGHVVRRANRSYVAEQLPSIARRDLNADDGRVRQLFEVRQLIEPPMIALAVMRATASERDELRSLAGQFHEGLSFDDFRDLDRQFHSCLARLAHNPLLAEVYSKVLDALFASDDWKELLQATLGGGAQRRIVAASGREHRRIAAALLDGSPSEAADSAAAHLRTVERSLIAQLEQPRESSGSLETAPRGNAPTRRRSHDLKASRAGG
jgi:GntR family transcriptional regulator, transcriptional repressor for pyruvate dehydrogenase complex